MMSLSFVDIGRRLRREDGPSDGKSRAEPEKITQVVSDLKNYPKGEVEPGW